MGDAVADGGSVLGAAPVIGLPRPAGLGWAAALAERVTGLSELEQLRRRLPAGLDPAGFVTHALQLLELSWCIESGNLDDVPSAGPLVVVANHPYGAAEGLAIVDLLLRRRPDVRMLANSLLCRLPELAPLICPVDVFRKGVNATALRRARRHLEGGGALLVFPAGEVSRFDWTTRRVADPRWTDTAAQLARRTGARVLPIRVGGRAGAASLIAGAVHERLRTLLLARDLLGLRGRQLALRVGKPIPAAELARVPAPAQTAYLRFVTEAQRACVRDVSASRPMLPLVAPVAPARLQAAIVERPHAQLLLSQDGFDVYCIPGSEMGVLLDEVARLRELSFRMVQEGTGQSRDTDAYDGHYRHLILWHRESRAIAGAYRLGFTDEILPRLGVHGLYTHSLFDFKRSLFDDLGPSLELGRSFVSPEWQRSFHPLRLLWAGIARIIVQTPQLAVLFGPVSVSAAYSAAGRQLIADVLHRHRADLQLQGRVRPRHPLRRTRVVPAQRDVVSALADPQLLSRLLSHIERGPGLPVLLRHYLDLEARFAGFNVDDDFGSTLDGLVFVRVATIPPKILARFKSAAAG